MEPAEEFVKGLQERGMDELAIEYLDGLKTSPLANDETRKLVPYLRGTALVERAKRSTDPTERNKLLDEAQKELGQFSDANPHSVQEAEAQVQLATVQMTRGQELAAQESQLPSEKTYDSQRKDLGREARLRFAEARDTFQRAESIFSKELDKLPPTTSAEAREDSSSKRQELRGRVAQLRFLQAQTQFEAAQSYPVEADEFRKLNETAAEELSAVYDEFGRTMLVGLYARLYEGRCYQAVGNYQLAIGCYEELIGKDNILPAFRKLAAAAMQRKAEVLTVQDKLDAAIEACNACLKDAHKDEEKQPEWVGVRYRLAEALEKKATLTPDSPVQRKLMSEAREAYRLIAKSPGEFQVAARAAASAANPSSTSANAEAKAAKTDNKDEPRTFQAAYDAGKEALSSYNAAKQAIPSAEKNNPSAVPELQTQAGHGKEDARHYFQIASGLVDVDTDPKLVSEVRYFLCWLYWEAEDYYRAAVLGDFLARRYPDLPTASSAAKIAMAAYERLYNQAITAGNKKDDGDFEAKKMAQMAEFITRRWPGTENADAAFGVLVSFAIQAGRIEDAEKLLQQASAQSRPRLELLFGNALWGRYLELSQAKPEDQPDAAELTKLKATATKYLTSGYDGAKKESPLSEAGATAALYLAQSLLSDNDYEAAITLLEDKQTGPLALIEKQHPTASKPQYAVEAYKAALRAYVSVSPPQEKKATKTMQELEKVVQANVEKEKATEQLTRIYIGMGVALQKQMEDLRAAGKQSEANRVAAAFAKFLDRIHAENGDTNWPVQVWLAQTYYSLGAGQAGKSPTISDATAHPLPLGKVARDYVTKARDAYIDLLKEVAKDPSVAPSETSALAVKVQLAECYGTLGQYQESLDTLADILKERETSLAVQRAAAIAYQDRGEHEDVKWFENAIHGGYPAKTGGTNRIWGWLKISQVAGHAAKQDEKFRDTFFEARFNIARCHYLAAMKQSGDAKRQELDKAKQSVQTVAQLYPELGGDKWKSQYDQLLKDIRGEEGNSKPAESGG